VSELTPERWREVQAIFTEALERPSHEREAFLATSCAGDPELRAEVESLLQADADAPAILDATSGAFGTLLDEPAGDELTTRLQSALGADYRVERELSGGGMSRVFVAEELALGRRVVVKVLPTRLGATLDLERFRREVRLAASLRHPHIVPLLAARESDDGLVYYTMPYIEGESLRHRLDRDGPLPLAEVVRILREVADALSHAHRRGVIHRDVKPGNVLADGHHVFVTDFGIAKALAAAAEGVTTAAGSGDPDLDRPHAAGALTARGLVLGTPGYMAPEQAAGAEMDHRADIYSLGVLGYELVAGRPPFTGRTAREVVAAQVTGTPEPLTARRPACPPALEAVLMRCLEKRPADRWQTADDLLAALDPLATSSGEMQPVGASRTDSRWRVGGAAAAVVAALAAAAVLLRPASDVQLGRRVNLTLTPGLEIDPALSPDGKRVAFVAGPMWRTHLFVRETQGGDPAVALRSSGFVRHPRWSPDASRLLFRSERGLEMMAAAGGPSRLLVAAGPEDFVDGTWSPDGRSILYTVGDSLLVRPAADGPPRGLAELRDPHSCAWSPEGRWIACVSGNPDFVGNNTFGNIAASSLWVIPASGGAPVAITDDHSLNVSPAWLQGGRSLLFVSNRDGGRDIYQVTLNAAGRPARQPTRLTTGLNAVQVTTSGDGRRVAYAAFTETSNVWSLPIPAAGTASVSRAEPVTTGNQVIENLSVSPDGRWLAFDSDRGGLQQIYRTAPGGSVQQLTAGPHPAFHPDISPDGREVAYHAFQDGTRQVFVVSAGGGTPTQVTSGTEDDRTPDWSPDGRSLVFSRGQFGTADQSTAIVARDARGRWGTPRILRPNSGGATWSPDGRWILMARWDSTPGWELAAVPPGGGAGRTLLTFRDPSRDVRPISGAWSADSRLVYYQAFDPRDRSFGFWVVPVSGGTPRLVVRFDDPTRPWHRQGFRVAGGRFYFTLGDMQSDVWLTEVEPG
jgi:serine/threonine protein kinase/Tol biopolymer transport system component